MFVYGFCICARAARVFVRVTHSSKTSSDQSVELLDWLQSETIRYCAMFLLWVLPAEAAITIIEDSLVLK